MGLEEIRVSKLDAYTLIAEIGKNINKNILRTRAKYCHFVPIFFKM